MEAAFKRKIYVDLIKAFGIIFVILGHANFANDYVKEWLYSFHMPLFFFATGLTLKISKIDKVYVCKKIQVLCVPFLIWELIYSGYSLNKMPLLLYGSYWSINKGGSLGSLWFLPTMFCALIYVQLLLKIKNKVLLCLGMVVLFLGGLYIPHISRGYFWCADVAFMAAFFILCGFFFEKNKKQFSKKKLTVLAILSFLGTLLFLLDPLNETEYVLMADRRFGNPVIFLIVALAGCLMTYFVAKLIECESRVIKILSYIGMNSLIIFITHKPLLVFFRKFFSVIAGVPWFLELLVIVLGVLTIELLLTYFINKFAPALAGKNCSK